ncbi:sushi, nidogen and EGF-like domain-containing protein 1 [Parasteatoda tepidariorum]|uniref:sushi, nidogen and EGF-like domain-containing protein 1 n=1 Tax=Parasteatoda tepidariorum TaxID=114398 RepID=UPI001C7247B4|nr:sushi, nidogen and EGF-like domain-containing protein 1 [Parasteatoda tepidariorum]
MLLKFLICVLSVSLSYGFEDDVARRLHVEELQYENTLKKFDSYPPAKAPENAHCMCENGECLRDSSGELKCVCLPEYGLYDSYRCKACLCGPGANCTFQKGWFKTYVNCICPEGSKKGADNRCEDPCKSNPCKNGGKCRVDKNGLQCDCPYPYLGKFCEQDVCMENPCQNGGSCIVAEDEIDCICKPPFKGDFCEIGACMPNPCKNNGLCEEKGSEFDCYCKMPFYGKFCEKEMIPEYSSTYVSTISTGKIVSEDFNTTFSEPFNFTNEYDWTDEPLNYSLTINQTTDNLLDYSYEFNDTTSEPFNFTKDYDWTNEPLNYSLTINQTTDNFLNYTYDFNEIASEH